VLVLNPPSRMVLVIVIERVSPSTIDEQEHEHE
jgi:hypothetical protein